MKNVMETMTFNGFFAKLSKIRNTGKKEFKVFKFEGNGILPIYKAGTRFLQSQLSPE